MGIITCIGPIRCSSHRDLVEKPMTIFEVPWNIATDASVRSKTIEERLDDKTESLYD